MKKLKKFLTRSVMVVMAFVMALAAPIVNVCRKAFASSYDYTSGQNETDNVKKGATFAVSNIKSKWTVDDDVQVPGIADDQIRSVDTGEVVSADEKKVVVYDPNGKDIGEYYKRDNDPSNDETEPKENLYGLKAVGDNYEFKPAQIGTYKVEYAVKYNNVWTVANKYELKVSASTYSYAFVENDPIILPATIDTKNEVPNVTLPLPKVFVEEEQVKFFKIGSYTNSVIVATYNESSYKYEVARYDSVAKFVEAYNAAHQTATPITAEDVKYTMIMEVNTDTKNYINNQAVYEAPESKHAALQLITDTNNPNVNYYNFKADEGTNVIRYRLIDAGMNICYEESKKITGSNSNDSTKIDIGFTVNNATTKASLKDKTYLPLASAYDKNNANTAISVYTIVEIKYYEGRNDKGELTYSPVEVKRDDKGIYFIPEKPGDYEVTYKVKDFYGHEGYTYNYTIKDVKDTVAPTLYIVDSYDVDRIEEIKDQLRSQDYKYIVPTKYGLDGVEITLPAVYAEDSATTNFKDLTIRRRITSSDFQAGKTGSIYLDTDTDYTVYEDVQYSQIEVKGGKFYKKGTEEEITGDLGRQYKASQTAKVKLNAEKFAAGNYTIYYTVSDGNGNTSTWSTTLNLVESNSDNVAPEIKYQTNQTVTVNNDQEVIFDAPTITDNADSALVNKYFIYFPATVELGGVAAPTFMYKEVFLNKDGKIQFNTNEVVTNYNDTDYTIYDIAKENGCTFTLVTYSFDDQALKENELTTRVDSKSLDSNIVALCKTFANPLDIQEALDPTNIGVKTTRFAVIDENDGNAPIFTGVAGTDLETEYDFDPDSKDSYEQNGKIFVDGVKIWDNRKGLTIVAIIRDSEGKVVQAYNTLGKVTSEEVAKDAVLNPGATGETTDDLKAPEKGWVYTLPGISFTASLCDSYTVTYVATDRAGYVATYTAVLPQTADKESPVISGHKASTYELELGQSLSLVDIVAKDNSGEEITVEADCVDHSNYIHEVVEGIYEFAPQQTGTYKLTFNAEDGAGNPAEPVTITVQVKHTVKPVIKLLSESVQTTYFGDKVSSADFSEIYLPGYVVVDESESQFGFELDELKNYSEIKITGPVTYVEETEATKGQPHTIKYHEGGANNAKYSFKPTTKGTYTVTYSAWDEHNNEAEPVVIEITVGETVPPTINVEKELNETLDKEILVGTTLTIDMSKVNVTDNIMTYEEDDEIKTYEYKAELTITDSQGNVVSADVVEKEDGEEADANIKSYTFENAGEYTLTFTAKDTAGNSQVYTKTIKVVSEESKKTDVTTVVGTILIVVSLAILAGVIVYFARTPKTATAPKAKKAEKKESKKDENKD